MSGDRVFELLNVIRTDITGLRTAAAEVEERLGFLESQSVSLSRRFDRIDQRLDRIEVRLGSFGAGM